MHESVLPKMQAICKEAMECTQNTPNKELDRIRQELHNERPDHAAVSSPAMKKWDDAISHINQLMSERDKPKSLADRLFIPLLIALLIFLAKEGLDYFSQ